MARPRNPVPSYKKHPTKNEARCWLDGRWVSLGPWKSEQSLREYERLCAKLRASSPAAAARDPRREVTVEDVLLAFVRYADGRYRDPDGSVTSELKEYRAVIETVGDLFGDTPAAEFGPLALQTCRRAMIDRGWCRGRVNKQVGRVRRVFRWAAGQELAPASVPQALACVQGLQKGRTDARESEPVGPVDPANVAATLPFLNRHVGAMVEVQRLTGMRPCEVCRFRLGEVERSGDVWLYWPERHKTAHRGKTRVVPIGPKARAVLIAFLRGDAPPPDGFAHADLADDTTRLVMADAYQEAGRERDAALLRDLSRPVVAVDGCVVDPGATVFSPAAEREDRFRAARRNRKSKVQPSQLGRKKAAPKRVPGREYHPHAYSNAIARACKKGGIPHWHPGQLRHTFATEVRRDYGLEAAQVLLGHARADVTQVYAERNLALAVRVAGEIG